MLIFKEIKFINTNAPKNGFANWKLKMMNIFRIIALFFILILTSCDHCYYTGFKTDKDFIQGQPIILDSVRIDNIYCCTRIPFNKVKFYNFLNELKQDIENHNWSCFFDKREKIFDWLNLDQGVSESQLVYGVLGPSYEDNKRFKDSIDLNEIKKVIFISIDTTIAPVIKTRFFLNGNLFYERGIQLGWDENGNFKLYGLSAGG